MTTAVSKEKTTAPTIIVARLSKMKLSIDKHLSLKNLSVGSIVLILAERKI
jgi:hypothetical protein